MSRRRRDALGDLPARAQALAQAADCADGRVDAGLVDEARRVADQVDRRLSLSGQHTVIALAGSTGSGKSSTFNAISGTTLAEPGIRRPTTSATLAATFGPDSADRLLEWLEVPRRHEVHDADPQLDGLVLLDLPDHDSTEQEHRREVDRLVKVVDLLVWVVDPQKYADALLHDSYLRPFARHARSMVVVLNQVDRLTPEQVASCMSDLRRLLDSEGLRQTSLIAASAVTGAGMADLTGMIARVVADKQAVATRLSDSLDAAAGELGRAVGRGPVQTVAEDRITQLVDALGEAAGADAVIDAVFKATRLRGTLATGWPVVSWLARFRPDPLRRLHLGRALPAHDTPDAPVRIQRSALPGRAGGVQQARVDQAIRDLATAAGTGLPRGFADAVRRASRSHDTVLTDRLDKAVATTDLGMDKGQGYWRPITVLQWLLIALIVIGGGWLLLDLVLTGLQLPRLPSAVRWNGVPLPTLLLVGAAGAGVVLAVVSRAMVELTARARATRALNALRASIREAGVECVVDPVTEELRRLVTARAALDRASADRTR